MWLVYKIIFKYLKKRLSQSFIGSLEIVFPNNKKITLGKGKYLQLHILNNFYLFKLLFFGLPYLGYGYSKGYWKTNNLDRLLEIGIKNKSTLKSFAILNFISLFYQNIFNFLNKNTLKKSKKQISFHYDLGNNFYKLWLDKSMTYSSAIFTNKDSLQKAQNYKYETIAKLANIKNNHSVLEIGCGWGGFIRYIEKNIGAKVTGLTLSNQQFNYVKSLSNGSSQVKLKDYRTINKSFDRIVSIEMFEAVGQANWNIFFKSLKKILNSNGIIALQIITIAEKNFYNYFRSKDFIQKYIFPGGMLPTKSILNSLAVANGFSIREVNNFGRDYAKTLNIWRKNFINNWEKIEKLGFDNNFKRLWEYYLNYCEVGFKNKEIDVAQFILKNKR